MRARIVVSSITLSLWKFFLLICQLPSTHGVSLIDALATPITPIKASSSWEHAEHEVTNLTATTWAGYKELDGATVLCPSLVLSFHVPI